jgi:hypothetical protein
VSPSSNPSSEPGTGSDTDGSAFACVGCRLPLPIRVAPDHPDSIVIRCAFCGHHYRGVLVAGAGDSMRNIRITTGSE